MPGFPSIALQKAKADLSAAMVFGERNSGTNHVMELLRRNFPAFADSPGDRIGDKGFAYGWKHAFPQMVAAPDTTLAIGVFRDPEDWVQSMHRRPWHSAPALRGLPIGDFLRHEWRAQVDEVNFGVSPGDPRWQAELQWDRHPLTGDPFANLCALRVAKNAGFLSLPKRFVNCLLVRHEDVARAPQDFVHAVSAAFQTPRKRRFVAVETRRGRDAEGTFQPARTTPLSKTDRAFLWSQLDPDQERHLGYGPKATLAG